MQILRANKTNCNVLEMQIDKIMQIILDIIRHMDDNVHGKIIQIIVDIMKKYVHNVRNLAVARWSKEGETFG